jgi:hypothetical protein
MRPTALAGDQYGQESVDTLVKEMEDRRDDLVLIVAAIPIRWRSSSLQIQGLVQPIHCTTTNSTSYTDED